MEQKNGGGKQSVGSSEHSIRESVIRESMNREQAITNYFSPIFLTTPAKLCAFYLFGEKILIKPGSTGLKP